MSKLASFLISAIFAGASIAAVSTDLIVINSDGVVVSGTDIAPGSYTQAVPVGSLHIDPPDTCPECEVCETCPPVVVDPPDEPLDSDGDGIADEIDACPTEPAQTPDGCPLPPVDTDGDGVPDETDQCADTPAGDEVDSVGCTVVPPDIGELADTTIGQLAASMEPGDYALLSTPSPFLGGYRTDGSPAPAVDEWTSSNYWDSATRTTYFMGLRVSNRFMSYRADSDSWIEYSLGEGVENAPERFPGTGHMYERSAFDESRGHFYHMRGGAVYRYVISTGLWEQFSVPEFGNQVIEWNDSIDMLVNLDRHVLVGFRDGVTYPLGDSPVDGYHSSARFNKKRGDMLMIGGNYSKNTVALMRADGTVEQRADAPFGFSINTGDLTYDPVTGNYIVVGPSREAWEYSPDLDEWRNFIPLATSPTDWPWEWYMRQVPVVIDELGVIAWQTPKGFLVQKHQSVFTQQELDDAAADPVVIEPPVVEDPPVVSNDPPGWTSDGTLLVDQAATMHPGEWRNLAGLTTWPGKDGGRKFKSFQYVYNGSTGADGMGWTQDLVYDNGRLMLVLNRSGIQRALIGMNSDGAWWRLDEPEGFVGTDRRPFNKLMQDDEYLYFTPNGCKECMGYFIRTPLDNPGVFEDYGIPIGDDQMDSVGNFAAEYVPEWDRFYAYTPGGKLWTWTHGETEWTLLDRFRYDLSGYAGVLVWNPVKKELIVAGGQVFGESENLGAGVARITEPMGKMELLPDMEYPDGSPLYYTAAQSRLIVDPRDGSYIQIANNKNIYRNDEAGGTYEYYDSVDQAHGWQLGNYELYTPYAFVPGTDVIVFVSHIRGVVLYRLKELTIGVEAE